MMEERVRRLEAEVSEVRRDISAVGKDVSELKGKVSMLPGYPGIALIMTIVTGALLGFQRIIEASGVLP